MKLLAAEVAYLFGAGKWLKSYVAELEDANMKGLEVFKRALEDMESGGVFRKFLNITNFIEGDYFSWYLEDLDQETANKIADLAKRLADYEPATPILEPEYTRDLLKRLYQNLVPKKIRHDLGEYYTPDWLAELLLNEVGLTTENFEKLAEEKSDLTSPLNLRVLDPACGSGTFLALTIKRFREYAEEHYLKDVLASYMLRNIVGFDLNPLAVLTARTNYLLAVADLLVYAKGPIEIPIYLADSLLVETRTTLTGVSYAIRTYVGEFELPKSIVDKGMLGKLLEAIDRYVRLRYRLEEFKQVVKEELKLNEEELCLVGGLYKTFSRLQEDGKNHVWTAIIKNAFAPLTTVNSGGKFDFVNGNPPWINWESLPEDYRIRSRDLWDTYGLLKVVGVGAFKRELASLFVARCTDRYVQDGGRLAFLVPFTIFKNQAASGLRQFLAKGKPSNKISCKVLKVHDLVTLFPFEGAINRTAMIILEKTAKTEFPFPCVVWHNPHGGGINPEESLDEVKGMTSRFEMTFRPVTSGKPETPWMQITEEAYVGVSKMLTSGKSRYEGHNGVYTGLNQAYWIEIRDERTEDLLVSNVPVSGQKKKIRQVEEVVEKDLVYNFVRGRDVKKWYISGEYGWIIIPHFEDGRPIEERKMKVEYPKTYRFFKNFESELKKRTIKPFLGKGPKTPFYRLDNIGSYTFEKYKIVWKPIAGAITGKATSFASAVLEPLKRGVCIPDHSLMFVSFKSRDECHYVNSVWNSSIFLLAVASYSYEIGGYAHVIDYIGIPEFDTSNVTHKKLSELSKKAHEIAKQVHGEGKEELLPELRQIESEVDRLVAGLYGIEDKELDEITKCFRILKEGEIEEVEETAEEPEELRVNFLNAVMSLNDVGSFEVAITNPLKEEVKIELQLPNRKVELKTDKEEDTIKVKVLPLPAGEHKIPYKIITTAKVAQGEFTLHVKEKKRFRKDESLTGKLDELLEES
jgi:SAM-dependent methyltransferase